MQNTNLKPVNIKSRDIFISYRRACGGTVAAMLYELLIAKGFNIFFDDAKLGSGNYIENIREEIISSNNLILIVSSTVFESKNVIEEVQIALDADINIIPIFVNEVVEKNKLPDSAPEFLKLAKLNGVKFGNEKINSSIESLSSKLVMPRQVKVVQAFIEHYKENELEDALVHIKNVFVTIGEEKILIDSLTNSLSDLILSRIAKSNIDTGNIVLRDILKATSTRDIKEIAKKLKISSCGTHGLIIERICANLINTNDTLHYDKDQDDRYEYLFDAIEAECKKLKNRNELAEKLESETGVTISTSSMLSVIDDIFENFNSVHDIFDFLKLPTNNVKSIFNYIIDTDEKFKKESDVIDRIAEWVNYKDDSGIEELKQQLAAQQEELNIIKVNIA